ncbi:hypothetical protein [Streptomyces pseudovenezuelae]|uniref:Uncharacterized protein n=1 Tax=Streptomyces pseudovenezuelae TaxID=67350 RepID=A0ABT6LMB1_9ACTN|nr:hypothetical protein [Streptomyces pseudovenezuelae]MDH6217090.1 hypothetical protein [Streptomyces pseudovenezuelae]
MKKTPLNTKGFGLLGVLTVVLVVAIAGLSGWFVWHKNHDNKKTASSNNSTSNKDKGTNAATTDPYAGWKTYADAQCGFSFKYPASWSLETTDSQVSLSNPADNLQVSYIADDSHDQGSVEFTTTSLTSLGSLAGHELTEVSGYVPNSGLAGNYLPMIEVANTSDVTAAGLKVGDKVGFVNNPTFTGKSSSCTTSIRVEPSVTINTVADAQAWLTASDTKTSSLILKSLSYNQ